MFFHLMKSRIGKMKCKYLLMHGIFLCLFPCNTMLSFHLHLMSVSFSFCQCKENTLFLRNRLGCFQRVIFRDSCTFLLIPTYFQVCTLGPLFVFRIKESSLNSLQRSLISNDPRYFEIRNSFNFVISDFDEDQGPCTKCK